MGFVGKSVTLRLQEACEYSYELLTRYMYPPFLFQSSWTAPYGSTYVRRLFAEAPAARDAVAGKLAVVTGISIGGSGFHMVAELALKGGMSVVLMGSSKKRLHKAMAAIAARAAYRKLPAPVLYEITYDLDDLTSARTAAEFVIQLANEKYNGELHILINNAGAVDSRYKVTKQGIESNVGRNHVFPHYLTRLLIPSLQKAAREGYKPRVVTVASMGHAWGPDWQADRMLADPATGGAPEGVFVSVRKDGVTMLNYADAGDPLMPTRQYGRAKMGSVANAVHLAQLYPEINFTSQHPGSIASNFGSSFGLAALIYKFGFYFFQYIPSQAAAVSLRAALDPDFNTEQDLQGAYLMADGNPWYPKKHTAIDPLSGKIYRTFADFAKAGYEATEALIKMLL